jgi:hypothetical protein
MPRRFVPLVLLTATTALVAACSGSTPYVPPSTTPGASDGIFSSVPSPSFALGTATAPATKAELTAMMLVAKDMGGWKVTPYKASAAADKAQAAFATCIGAPDSPKHRVADVHSPDFKLQATQVSTVATSFASRADVDRDAAALLSSKTPGCFKTLLQSEAKTTLPAGSRIGAVSAQVSKRTSADPENVVARATANVPVTASGQSVMVYTDVVYLRSPFIEAEVRIFNLGNAVDKELEKSLVSTVAARVAKGG